MESLFLKAGEVIGNNWLALLLIAIFITWRVSREVNKLMVRFDAFDVKLAALEASHKLEVANRDKLCCDRLKLIEKNKAQVASRQLKLERIQAAMNATVKKHCTMLTKILESLFPNLTAKQKKEKPQGSLEAVKERLT